MPSRRRILLLSIALATGLALVLWHRRGILLNLERDHAVVGRLLVPAARLSSAGAEVVAAAALLDEPRRSAETRAKLREAFVAAKGETMDFGFGPGDAAAEIAPAADGRISLGETASALLRTQDNPLLILRSAQPTSLAKVGARRGWIGPLAAEILGTAKAIGVAVAENPEDGWMHITLALEFEDGTSAESALKRLTAANGDFGQLGFIAEPGYERIVRRTHLVVIRLDARADTVARHLTNR